MAVRAAIIATVVCLVAAGLEGLFAGAGVRDRLARLRRPRLAPPFFVWVAIGLGYYVICFTLLYRLLRSGVPSTTHVVSLGLIGMLLLVNALWNFFFFRRRDLRAAVLLNIPYVAVAIALTGTLLRIGDGSVWVFAPYMVYLIYGVYYGYAMWRLNEGNGS